jgi:Protein of unknown function (DUF2848)
MHGGLSAPLALAAPSGPLAGRFERLVVAGWAARDEAAVRHHIAELAALGVRPPREVPLFYRVAASLLTTDTALQVAGTGSTGEAEAVLLSLPEGLFVGVGSDHTDRAAEAAGVTWSKQMCTKPIGPAVWPFAEVAPHWDRLVLFSRVERGGAWAPYQRGTLGGLRRPEDLVARYAGPGGLPPGTAMFLGTMPVADGISWADAFEATLEDPVLGRSITCGYRLEALSIAD